MGALKIETIAVLGVALAVVFLAYKAKDTVTDVAQDAWDAAKEGVKYVNPASDQNAAYQGVNSIGAWLSGNNKFDLGGAAYDATHGGALDVTSSNNAAYSGVNGIGAWLSGDKNFDLGSKIYDWTH
jgi:hypothetical protein